MEVFGYVCFDVVDVMLMMCLLLCVFIIGMVVWYIRYGLNRFVISICC